MEWKFSKNEKVNKVILVVLIGVMLLVIVMPMGQSAKSNASNLGSVGLVGQQAQASQVEDGLNQVSSYETKLTSMLEQTYGTGTVQVMIYKENGESTNYYGASDTANKITGVLIVISGNVVDENTVSDITMAVCALFNLPAHKVAVLVKR